MSKRDYEEALKHLRNCEKNLDFAQEGLAKARAGVMFGIRQLEYSHSYVSSDDTTQALKTLKAIAKQRSEEWLQVMNTLNEIREGVSDEIDSLKGELRDDS